MKPFVAKVNSVEYGIYDKFAFIHGSLGWYFLSEGDLSEIQKDGLTSCLYDIELTSEPEYMLPFELFGNEEVNYL